MNSLAIVDDTATNLTNGKSFQNDFSTMPRLDMVHGVLGLRELIEQTPGQTEDVFVLQVNPNQSRLEVKVFVEVRAVLAAEKHLLHQLTHPQAVTDAQVVILTNQLAQFHSGDLLQIQIQKSVRPGNVGSNH